MRKLNETTKFILITARCQEFRMLRSEKRRARLASFIRVNTQVRSWTTDTSCTANGRYLVTNVFKHEEIKTQHLLKQSVYKVDRAKDR